MRYIFRHLVILVTAASILSLLSILLLCRFSTPVYVLISPPPSPKAVVAESSYSAESMASKTSMQEWMRNRWADDRLMVDIYPDRDW